MSRTELMEIGEHCSFCGQIDFLPFKCSCKSSFCSQHRQPEAHNCPDLKLKSKESTKQSIVTEKNAINTSHLPSASSLFPDRSNFKVDLKTTETNPTNLKGTLTKSNNTSAISKLKRFFEKNSKSSKKATSNPSKRIIETAQLKSKATGDGKVPASEKIHIWVQVLDEENNQTIDKNVKHPIFISRGWPIGRALDSIATQLKLKNINNRTNDSSQRLFLFKVDNGEKFTKLNTGDRCSSLKDGDNIYIVRGTEV